MRISEIANAEEQIGLLKIIMDKTWEALTAQAQQQAQQAQAKAAAKPRAVKTHTVKGPYAPPPPRLPLPNKPPQQNKQQPRMAHSPQQHTQQVSGAAVGKSFQTLPKASSDSKDGFLQQTRSGSETPIASEGGYS